MNFDQSLIKLRKKTHDFASHEIATCKFIRVSVSVYFSAIFLLPTIHSLIDQFNKIIS